MAKENSRKIKLLKIWEILYNETDENNPITTYELIDRLAEMGIEVDRKILYEDIAILGEWGYEIQCNRSSANEYFVVDRNFDIPELRILMDAVRAASFITPKKTKDFVKRIARLAGDKKAEVMQKYAVEFHIPKSDNEKIYYSVDTIGTAIEEGKQISFLYFDYDVNHNRVYRRDKCRYKVSPIATVFSDDNYYLLCYDDKHDDIGHYRVDRMDGVQATDDPIVKKQGFDLATYKKRLFGMFSGDDAHVTFRADRSLLDHIFDKFGNDVRILNNDGVNVTFAADVKLSVPFLGWCCSFGNLLQVVAPTDVVKQVRTYLSKVAKQYKK